jgi:5-methylcytosine-specific restriction endonuclease McrA
MNKRKFNEAERYAVFTVHAEKCWLCTKPVTLQDMEIDHIIPERLMEEPSELASVRTSLGLPDGFDVQSFENWMPACGPCNERKGSNTFEPTPLIQLHIQKAREKAPKARQLCQEMVGDKKLARAWNTIMRASERGQIPSEDVRRFVAFHERNRAEEIANTPVLLTGIFRLIKEIDGLQLVEGPFGVGAGPAKPSIHMTCGVCGNAFFNGVRCVTCGNMLDD